MPNRGRGSQHFNWLALLPLFFIPQASGAEDVTSCTIGGTLPTTLSLVVEEGKMLMACSLNQSPDTGWLEVDTGAHAIILSKDFATSAPGDPPVLHLGSLHLTLARLKTRPGKELAGMSLRRRVVGLLGMDFFAAASVHLDPRDSTMTVSPRGSPAPGTGWAWLTLTMKRGIPCTPGSLYGQEGLFLLDTGARDVMLYASFGARLTLENLTAPLIPATYYAMDRSRPITTSRGVTQRLRLGPLDLQDVAFMLDQAVAGLDDGIVGFPILSLMEHWWDVSGGRVGFRTSGRTLASPAHRFPYDWGLLLQSVAAQHFPEALSLCRQLRKVHPDRIELFIQEVDCLTRMGKIPEGEALLAEGTQAFGGHPLFHYALGSIRFGQRRHAEALAAFQHAFALGLSGDGPEPLSRVATCHQFLNQHEEVLKVVLRAARYYPWDPFFIEWAGIALTRLNRFEDAVPYLERSLNPASPGSLTELAKAYVKVNRPTDAITLLSRTRDLIATKKGPWRAWWNALQHDEGFLPLKDLPAFRSLFQEKEPP